MKALVIGGTGFLGLHIAQRLHEEGHEVAVTRRRSSNTLLARKLGLTMLSEHIDLDDEDNIGRCLKGFDVCFFAAGHYPSPTRRPRTAPEDPTANEKNDERERAEVDRGVGRLQRVMAQSESQGIGRFIYTGTVATIGEPIGTTLASESDGFSTHSDISLYIRMKVAMEKLLLNRARASMDVICLCPTGCVGPLDYKMGTSQLVLAAVAGTHGACADGLINIVDARDVAAAHVSAITHGTSGSRYILGGHNTTVMDFLRAVVRRHGGRVPSEIFEGKNAISAAIKEEREARAENRAPRLTQKMAELAVLGQHVSSLRAQTDLNFNARSLEQTIDDTCAWYTTNGFLRLNEDHTKNTGRTEAPPSHAELSPST